jgi:phage/plasmid-like protein (TIGR03299 family)
MAHELMNDNAMFYVGQTPWHGLGNKLEIAPNTDNALKLSGLDWEVHKTETYIRLGDSSRLAPRYLNYFNTKESYHKTNYCCTYRIGKDVVNDKPVPIILGHVSEKYEVLQNKEAFQPFDEVLLEHGYTYETAGAVKDGQKIWILAKAPERLIVGNDDIDKYVLLFNSHNGSTGVTMKPTMIRVVCNNTLEYALNQQGGNGISLRHTIGVKDRLSSLTEALKACDADISSALEIMRRMNDAEINYETMTKYFETVFPTLVNRESEMYHPTTKRKVPNFAKPQFEALVANYRHGKGNNGKTMWDAYNSITEYIDHTKNYSDPMASIGFGWGKNVKQNAFKIGNKFITN